MTLMKKIFVIALAMFVFAGAAHAQQSKPAMTGAEGQRAFDDLAKGYVNRSGLFDDKAALADLKSPDVTKAQRAGNYLLALFEQTLADESNGRALWHPTPFANEGPGNWAHEFRLALAADFGKSVSAEAALPAALWLIENDPIADDAEAGVHVLARIHSEGANKAWGQIISEVHPNQEVLVTAIKEAGTRHLTLCKDGVVALEQSYRKAVREAAVRSAAQLGETNPVPYDPLKAFSPRVLALLKVTLDQIIMTPVPADAQWLDGIEQPMWSPGRPFPVQGWLLGKEGDKTTFLDTFGQVRTVTETQATAAALPPGTFPKTVEVAFTPGTLAQTAEHFAHLQAEVAEEKRQFEAIQNNPIMQNGGTPEARALSAKLGTLWRDMDEKLKEMTTEMRPMEPPGGRFLNLPEMTVAAWCWQRGDLASTAAILFPCYDAAQDDRWLDWSSRDDIGTIYDLNLLQKFTVERNYPAAIALAAHLGSPAFDGYVYQARSKELAAQLAKRAEDFTTLTLPSAADWAKIKTGLDRPGQIVWLASRLKLMHCINPGYDEVQYATAYPNDNAPPGAPEVINPYSELIQLNLTPTDLLVLAPYAADQDYSPSYTFYKDWIPERGLSRVSGAVGDIINQVAGHEIVHETGEGIAFQHGTAATIETDLQAWIAAHQGDTPDKLIAQTLRTSNNWKDLKEAAIHALKIHHVEVLNVLADRIDTWPKEKGNAQFQSFQLGDFVHLFYSSHAPMVTYARQWIKSPNPEVRLWASLILVRDGDVAHDEGLDTLEPLLGAQDAVDRYLEAAPTLLASSSPRARRLAAALFPRINVHVHEGNDLQMNWVFQLYFVNGRKECLDFLIKALDDYTIDPNTHNDSGDPVYLTDSMAFWLGTWGRGLTQSPRRTGAEQRQYRAKLKDFLNAQFALIQQGKPSAVHATLTDQYEQYLSSAPARRRTAQEAAGTQD